MSDQKTLSNDYSMNKPCNTCPYQSSAKLQHWSKEEFKGLVGADNQGMNNIYGCHKENGCLCIGWLMMQNKNHFPSFKLRMKLLQDNVKKEYLESLSCDNSLYRTTNEMIEANFPEILI